MTFQTIFFQNRILFNSLTPRWKHVECCIVDKPGWTWDSSPWPAAMVCTFSKDNVSVCTRQIYVVTLSLQTCERVREIDWVFMNPWKLLYDCYIQRYVNQRTVIRYLTITYGVTCVYSSRLSLSPYNTYSSYVRTLFI